MKKPPASARQHVGVAGIFIKNWNGCFFFFCQISFVFVSLIFIFSIYKFTENITIFYFGQNSSPILGACLDSKSAFPVAFCSPFFFFFFFSRVLEYCSYCSINSNHKCWLSTVNSIYMHCLRTHKFYFLSIFSLKIDPILLFTHLKIILLQYFQFQQNKFYPNTR